jgi:hypothetical protein
MANLSLSQVDYLLGQNLTNGIAQKPLKLLLYSDSDIVYRQLPDLIREDLVVFTTDKSCKDYDFVFIFHHSAVTDKIQFNINKERLIFISMEPSDELSKISLKFLEQFGAVVTSDGSCKHPNIFKFNVTSWWVGLNVHIANKSHLISLNSSRDFKFFNAESPIDEFRKKLNRISVIRSSKKIFPGHTIRDRFIDYLISSDLGSFIDVYGGEDNYFIDKYDVIARYKFHLVIENYIDDDYWSEKLADVFLCNSFPIYAGCSNIYKYFNINSLLEIDLNDFERSRSLIADLMQRNILNKIGCINESKIKVLYKYNLFNIIYCIARILEPDNPKYSNVNNIVFPNVKFLRGLIYFYIKKIYMAFSKLKYYKEIKQVGRL